MTFLLCLACIYLFLGSLILVATSRDLVKDHWRGEKVMIVAGGLFMLLFGPVVMALFMSVELYAFFVWTKGHYYHPAKKEEDQ